MNKEELLNQLKDKDEKGFYVKESYNSKDKVYCIDEYLGRIYKEVASTMRDKYDWNYRAWHGEMDAMLKAEEQLKQVCR